MEKRILYENKEEKRNKNVTVIATSEMGDREKAKEGNDWTPY
jgi:hypothetical protein